MRALKLIRLSDSHGQATDAITLDAEGRHLRRRLLITENGREILVDLPLAVMIEDGDHLELEDGSFIEVNAAEEELLEIKAVSAAHHALLAWHIGNRHLAAQIEGARILIKRDAIIAVMLQQLGATVSTITEKFQPEQGAYHGHGH